MTAPCSRSAPSEPFLFFRERSLPMGPGLCSLLCPEPCSASLMEKQTLRNTSWKDPNPQLLSPRERGRRERMMAPPALAQISVNRLPVYLRLRLLLSLLLVAVSLGLQARPVHVLWFQSAIWGAALGGGRRRLPRLSAQVNAAVPLAALKTLLCEAQKGLRDLTPKCQHGTRRQDQAYG